MAEGGATHAGRDAGGDSDSNVWTEPVSIRVALRQAPVFIRLEEGDRGATENLSFSAGDIMALEGVKVSRGRKLVMAHYMTQLEEDIYAEATGPADSGLYLALLTIPYEHLPDIDVSIRKDPGGHFYSNFLATNFPNYNWKEQQDELLDSLDEHDYTNVSIITPRPRQDKEKWSFHNKTPPPPPPKPEPKPRAPIPSDSTDGGADAPPRRPPKPSHLSMKVSSASVPPRPPRTSHSSSGLMSSVYAIDRQEDISGEGFNMPAIAELFASGGSMTDDSITQPLPQKDKQKHKIGGILRKVKKAYDTMSRSKTPPDSPKGQKRQLSTDDNNDSDDGYIEIIDDDRFAGKEEEEAADNSSDEDDNYDVIDEIKMNPKYDKPPDKAASEKEQKKAQKKGEKQKKEKEKKGNTRVKETQGKPTVRVSPHGVGGVPLSSSPSQPFRLQMSPPATATSGGDPVFNDTTQKIVTSPLEDMSCDALFAHLQRCGMEDVAKVCRQHKIDGKLFAAIKDEDFKKKPFSVSGFELTRVNMVKRGWVPNDS